MQKKKLTVLIFSVLAGATSGAQAAFFQLAENSPAGLGNAFSGGSAIAEDASTVWYNPAGLTQLSGSQLVIGAHYIMPSTKFHNGSTTLATLPVYGSGNISGGDGGDAGEKAFVPNLYFARQLSDRMSIGLGINAPYGLATEYDGGWVGRYHALRSEIKTVNVNPALAFKASDSVSLGFGVSYQKMEATLTQAVDYGSICAAVNLAGGGATPYAACALRGAHDGDASVTADDKAWGFNLGALWQVSADTRIGAAYRSKIKHKLKGNFDVTSPDALSAAAGVALADIVDSGAKADVTLPATLSLSLNQALSPTWVLMADVTRTYWSKLPELRIVFDSSQPDSVVTLNLKDVNRYSIGAKFVPGGAWTFQGGLALDQTPTPDETVRTPRLPDTDRKWFALGADYKSSGAWRFDVACARLVGSDVSINKTATSTNENCLRGNISGTYTSSVNILSAQANWTF
jgi:long-chain fatty acid transport protein